MLEVETGVSAQPVGARFPVMRGGIIQQNDHRAAQVPQPFAQKPADLLLPEVVNVEQIIEAQLLSPGAQGNSGKDGDLVAPPLAMPREGCLALPSPGLDHGGNQQEARFINEY